MKKIISVASQKGGVGKTTTAITIATGLARKGKKVLLVDMDSQANTSKVVLQNYTNLEKEDTICDTILLKKDIKVYETDINNNLFVAPSHILLSNTDIELTTAIDHREQRLKNSLDKIKSDYDHIIIDCPPALSWLTINAFTASDEILVVVSPGYFELDSINQINKTLNEVKEYFNNDLSLLGYLFTMSDSTTNSKVSLDILKDTYGDNVLKTIIPRNTDIRDAHFSKQDIFDFNPKARSAEAYNELIQEISKK